VNSELRTVSRYARKACEGGFLGASVFLKKNQGFFFKNTLAPIDFLKGRLLSVAKNSPLWV
jgi:hypothetical protein